METVKQSKASIDDPQRTRKGRGFSDQRREHDEVDIDPEYCRDLGLKHRHASRLLWVVFASSGLAALFVLRQHDVCFGPYAAAQRRAT
jgi:hypothetical protein